MSDAIFPTGLPGIKWERTRADTYKTSVYEALSGAERRIRHRAIPKRHIDLSYEVLREQGTLAELQVLRSFFMARSGAFDSFLFLDPWDCIAANVQFGVGDGINKTFQLSRTTGDQIEVVHNPAASACVGRCFFPSQRSGIDQAFWPQPDGAWPSDDEYMPPAGSWTLLANGRVQFVDAPPAGKKLLWSGLFYHRARFANDVFDYTEFMHLLFAQRKLQLVLSLQNIL